MADPRSYEIQLVEMLRAISRAVGNVGVSSGYVSTSSSSQSINFSEVTVAVNGIISRLDTFKGYMQDLEDKLEYDPEHDAFHFKKSIYSDGFVTAGGVGSGGGGGGGGDLDFTKMWASLQSTYAPATAEAYWNDFKIGTRHLPGLIANNGLTAQYQTSGSGASLDVDLVLGISSIQTSLISNLASYASFTYYYKKTEVDSLIGAINQFKYEIYPTLGDITSPASNVLYLIGPTGSGSDKYEEYVYANSTFTKIGDTSIDLSPYLKSADAANTYVPLTRTVNGHALSANVTVTKGDVGLGNVENTALSTWTGSTYISTLGTISTGTWQGSVIGASYLPGGGAFTLGSTTINLGDTISSVAGLSKLTSSVLSLGYTLSDGVTESTLTWDSTHKAWRLEGNFYATGFITAGGVGSGGGGGGGGVDLPRVWQSLTNASALVESGTSTKIHTDHFPTLSAANGLTASYGTPSGSGATLATYLNIGVAAGYKLPTTSEWASKADASALNSYLPLSAGYGKALTGNLHFSPPDGTTEVNRYIRFYNSSNTAAGILSWSQNYIGNYLEIYNSIVDRGIGVGDMSSAPVFLTGGVAYPMLHSGNYSSYALSLAGGTIENNANNLLSLNNTSANGTSNIIYFYINSNYKASCGYFNNLAFICNEASSGYKKIGISDSGVPEFWDNDNTHYTLLHSNNYSSYALPLSGGTMSNTNVVTNLNADLLDGREGAGYFKVKNDNYCDVLLTEYNIAGYGTTPNGWGTYGPAIIFGTPSGDHIVRLQAQATGNTLYIQTQDNSTATAWKQFAFIDSNVASATKLQTARTIWGQSFDGTANVSGDIALGSACIYRSAPSDTWSDGTNSHIWYGLDMRYHNTGVYSTTLSDYFGLTLKTGGVNISMTNAGLVGIGTYTPQYNVDVVGQIHASNHIRTDGRVYAGDRVDAYRFQTYTDTYIMRGHNFTSALTDSDLAICANAGSGNLWIYAAGVCIGTTFRMSYAFNVSGVIYSTTGIFSDGYVTAGAAASSSDKRLKENISAISRERAKSVIMSLRPSEWTWNDKHFKRGKMGAGFIAQDVEGVLPFAVLQPKEYKYLEYNDFHGFEVRMLQDHQLTLDNHETRLEAAEREIVELKRENAELRARINN